MLIVEQILTKPSILEGSAEKLPDGVLLRILYPICNIDERNHNKRKYRREVWEGVHSDSNVQDKLKTRTLWGHAEHPQDTVQSSLEKASHIVTKLYMNESDNKEYAEFDVLDTPFGRIIETFIRAGCQVGVSTRAEGELKECEDDEGTYQDVLPESYRFVSVDFTADPSTFGAVPAKVERSVVQQVKLGLESKQLDKQFSVCLLEGCRVKEAGKLLESINKKSGQKKSKGVVVCEDDALATAEKSLEKIEEAEQKMLVKEGSKSDFIDTYGGRVKKLIKAMRDKYEEFSKLSEEEWEVQVQKIGDSVKNTYDPLVSDMIDNMLSTEGNWTVEDVASVGLSILNKYGTEMMQVVNAMEDVVDVDSLEEAEQKMLVKDHPKAQRKDLAGVENEVVKRVYEGKNDGTTFSAINDVEDKLGKEGYSIGSMQGEAPIGFAHGRFNIAKWGNISLEERALLSGIIVTDTEFRGGDATALYFGSGPDEDQLENERVVSKEPHAEMVEGKIKDLKQSSAKLTSPEIRVWCHPMKGGDDYYYPFASLSDAKEFIDKELENVKVEKMPLVAYDGYEMTYDEFKKEYPDVQIKEKVQLITEPAAALAVMAQEAGKSLEDAEKYYKDAKKQIGKKKLKDSDYKVIMGIVKKRLGLKTEPVEGRVDIGVVEEEGGLGKLGALQKELEDVKNKIAKMDGPERMEALDRLANIVSELSAVAGEMRESVKYEFVIGLKKENKDFEIKLAETRAELDKLSEFYMDLDVTHSGTVGKAASDILYLNSLAESLNSRIKELEASRTSLAERAIKESAVILKQRQSETTETLSKKDSEIAVLKYEQDALQQSIKETVDGQQKELKDLKEAQAEEVVQLKEGFDKALKKALVEKFVKCQIDFSGLQIPDQARVLLEQCETEVAASDLLERFKEALRESASYSDGKLSDVVVEGIAKSSGSIQLESRVGSAFAGMGKR